MCIRDRSTNECCDIDQLIVNAAISRGITSKPLCTLRAKILIIWKQQLGIMQQFKVSAFYTVVQWQKLCEVDSECTLHNSIVLAIRVPKIIKFGANLTKFWQKQVGLFFWPTPIGFILVSDATKRMFSSSAWSYDHYILCWHWHWDTFNRTDCLCNDFCQ